MQNIAVVFGECNTILLAFVLELGYHLQKTGSRVKRFTQIYADKKRRLPRIDVI